MSASWPRARERSMTLVTLHHKECQVNVSPSRVRRPRQAVDPEGREVVRSAVMKGYANPHLVVSPRALAPMLGGVGAIPLLVLDLRPPEAYAAGHIPGAIHLDLWGVSLVDTDPAPLKAFMWMIEHVLAVHGVDSATPIVVYDEQSGVRA